MFKSQCCSILKVIRIKRIPMRKITTHTYNKDEKMGKSVVDQCNLIFQRCKIRSSHRRRSVSKGVLRNFAKFTAKRLCQSLFFNKVIGCGLQLY